LITAGELRDRFASLEPIGLGPEGTTRLPWTPELEAAEGWFGEQAAAAGLRVERDPAGSLWAVPSTPGPWWAAGSHLDSVRGGGRFDGALGVVAAFAAAERASVPTAVIAFADEEGSRFGTMTYGSRALAGTLDVADALARTDNNGVSLRDALRAAGVDPTRLGEAPSWLGRLRGFLELHIEQSRELERAGVPAGVVTALAGRMRIAVEVSGRADHAATPRSDRRDALATAARLIVAADEAAGEAADFLVTAANMFVEPNALNTVQGRVRLWLDGRAPDDARLEDWRTSLGGLAVRLGTAGNVEITTRTAIYRRCVRFNAEVLAALDGLPPLVCFAGHDAGMLAERIPAGMVLVRNPTGVSHAPQEEVALEDAAAGANAMLAALEKLA
jgi:N-carbamoyl-L-amino-acid hydrolase